MNIKKAVERLDKIHSESGSFFVHFDVFRDILLAGIVLPIMLVGCILRPKDLSLPDGRYFG